MAPVRYCALSTRVRKLYTAEFTIVQEGAGPANSEVGDQVQIDAVMREAAKMAENGWDLITIVGDTAYFKATD